MGGRVIKQEVGQPERISSARIQSAEKMNTEDNTAAMARAALAAQTAAARAAQQANQRPTEGESKDYLFYQMIERGNRDMDSVKGNIRPEAISAYLTKRWMKPALTPEEQVYVRGAREFAAGVLRKKSGASMQPNEIADVLARYVDTFKDAPPMAASKRKAREEMQETFRKMSERAARAYGDQRVPAETPEQRKARLRREAGIP